MTGRRQRSSTELTSEPVLRTAGSGCGRRPSDGRARKLATTGLSSVRNCRRPYPAGRSVQQKRLGVLRDLDNVAVGEEPPVTAIGVVPDRIGTLRQAVVRIM